MKKLKVGQKIKGFATRHALSTGIAEVTAEVRGDLKEVSYKLHPDWFSIWAVIGRDFFLTRAEAEEAAKAAAKKKIAQLKKQLAKMQVLAEQPKHYKVKA